MKQSQPFPSFLCRVLVVPLSLVALATSALAEKPRIVCSLVPAAQLAAGVAGDVADVTLLVPENATPHGYTLRPTDMMNIEGADVLVTMGFPDIFGVEQTMLSQTGDARKVQLVSSLDADELTERSSRHTLQLGALHSADDYEHDHSKCIAAAIDPHIWTDPHHLPAMATYLSEQLQLALPEHAEAIQAQTERYVQRLQALASETDEAFKLEARSPVVTFHDAWWYLFERYDIPLAAVVTMNPDAPTRPKALVRLGRIIKRKDIPVVFTEPQFSSSFLDTLQADLGFSLETLDPLGSFDGTGDGLLTTIAHNRDTLLKHMQR